jgi:general stress protein 26
MDRQLSWDDVAAHLTGLANAATASSDGTPHVSVVAAVVDGDSIWITTKRSSGKAINLAENPRIALVFRPGSESYVSGTVEIVDDADEKRRRWSGFFPYDAESFFGPPENDGVVLLKVRPTAATVLTQDESGLHRRRWEA